MNQEQHIKKLQAIAVSRLALQLQQDADEALKPVIEKHRALFFRPRLEQVKEGLISNLECVSAQLDEIARIPLTTVLEMSDSESK